MGDMKNKKFAGPRLSSASPEHRHRSYNGGAHLQFDRDEVESEEGASTSRPREAERPQDTRPAHHRSRPHPNLHHTTSADHGHPPRNLNLSMPGYGQPMPDHRGGSRHYSHPSRAAGTSISDSRSAPAGHSRPQWTHFEEEEVGSAEEKDGDVDMDADGESDSSCVEEGPVSGTRTAKGFQQQRPVKRPLPVGLADLDSPAGRFVLFLLPFSRLFPSTTSTEY